MVSALHVHLAFVTRYRRRVLHDQMLTRGQQATRMACADSGAQLAEFNGQDNHVHPLATYPPKVAASAW